MKKQNANIQGLRRLAVVLTASAMAVSSPMTAFAAAKNSPNDQSYQPPEAPAPDYKKDISPEFAYTQDKWAALKDNVMEYGELADLIHEYNPTVRSNRYTYNDQKNQDLTDVYDELMDDARDAWDAAGEFDTDTYMGRLSSAQMDFSGNSLAKLADNNYMDSEMYKIQYDQTEANLVFQAQQLMVTYEQSGYTMKNLEANRSLAQANYEAVQAQQSVGMATEVNVLTAQKSVQDIDTSILSTQKSIDNVHRNLCLMLGWTYGAEVEICELPEPDMDWIASIDLAADVAKGLENNYSLRILERQINNARNTSNKASLEQSYKSQKETAATNIGSAYEQLQIAKSNYDQAVQSLALQADKMASAERKMAAGTINKNEYIQQKYAYTTAEVSEKTSRLSLLTAQNNYEWAVNGLASVS